VKKILLTGGAGYIGSHTCVSLVGAGYIPIVLDNFSNSHPEVLNRLEKIAGQPIEFELGDVADRSFLKSVFKRHAIEAVIHFAAFKSVSESVSQPLVYYRNNVGGMLCLLEEMAANDCTELVFSSTAAVYGAADRMPIPEGAPRAWTNPYAHSKIICEDIVAAHQTANLGLRTVVLRYFNPAGAHHSHRIGEDPAGVPANLVPYISQVAAGLLPKLRVFGNDYETADGTGVRDYIHVMDLAEGHIAALKYLDRGGESATFNLGSGTGYSVLEVITAFERACGHAINYEIAERREGDVAVCFADARLAEAVLGWSAARSLDQICEDAWRWQYEGRRIERC
jgi:UDP-glucose 4-epimerase